MPKRSTSPSRKIPSGHERPSKAINGRRKISEYKMKLKDEIRE
jgi:hypothetical protein